MLTKQEMQSWLRSVWTDVCGASLQNGHPAPYPLALAERLIKLFSFAGDTVLDPFAGTGSTALAAIGVGRSSISIDIEPTYIKIARKNLEKAVRQKRMVGAQHATLIIEKPPNRRRANFSRKDLPFQSESIVPR
jgi:site-specific DNA-methyltransferase (adenine-specific)